jgi:hypothetical protein
MTRNPLVSSELRLLLASMLVAALVAIATGCGQSGPELVPVRGKVTYGGGSWPKAGTVTFAGGPRPASAQFDEAGNFRVSSFEKREGLQPGKYKVSIDCWEVAPKIDKPGAEKSYVPPKYRNTATSGLEITVESGKPQTGIQWDVPKQ